MVLKKFISGMVVGALLFGAVPVFANSVKDLIGTKVTGVYTVEQNGKKLTDGIVIKGSAYVPVRAIAEATGTALEVKGKVIVLGDSKAKEDELNIQKKAVIDKIKVSEAAITRYETDVIPRAKERFEAAKGAVDEAQWKDWLDSRNKELQEHKEDLAKLQDQLSAIDAELEK